MLSPVVAIRDILEPTDSAKSIIRPDRQQKMTVFMSGATLRNAAAPVGIHAGPFACRNQPVIYTSLMCDEAS